MTFVKVRLVSSIDYLGDLSRSIEIDKTNSADIYRLVFKDRHLQAYDHNKLPPWERERATLRSAAKRKENLPTKGERMYWKRIKIEAWNYGNYDSIEGFYC